VIGLDRLHATLRAHALFPPGSTLAVARAPGRLDVMGGIADYSGALVLQRPIAEATFAAVAAIPEPVLDVVSIALHADGASSRDGAPTRTARIALGELAPGGHPLPYADARARFADEARHWLAYVAGVFLVLMHERGLQVEGGGARVVIASDVPEGKGVSSSAALETSLMEAVAAAFDLPLLPREIALLCQRAENLVAGAPCGVMDQMTCVFGDAEALLALLCQPADLLPSVPIPDAVTFWGIDSGERHAVRGSDYGTVRCGAFMGLRLLALEAGVETAYLANIAPEVFERSLVRFLPDDMAGAEFVARYGGTGDSATMVDPARRYPIRQPTSHPVYEHRRVNAFRDLLLASGGDERLPALGQLMYESHAGYSACGLGSPGTDRLVALVRRESAAGLHGARITGGGSGGTVAVVGRRDAGDAIARVAAAYEQETGHRPYVFSGSSPGVASFGARPLTT
jgi:L-arabinokinase